MAKDFEDYKTSSLCEKGGCSNCVAVKREGDNFIVTDTKNPGMTLTFTSAEWSAFIGGAKLGEFDAK